MVHMTLDEVILHFLKNLCLQNVDIHKKFYEDWAINKKCIAEKANFEILRLSFVTFNDLSGHT